MSQKISFYVLLLLTLLFVITFASNRSTDLDDDLMPMESELDCGEETSLLQRTLQLELLIETNKQIFLQEQDEYYTLFKNGNFTTETTLNHFWFASCNHQNRVQELWANLYNRTGVNNENPVTLDKGQLFLWLGDAIYLDRPPIPFPQPVQSQRADGTRQLWRKHYCAAVRRQIAMNGVVDDHDFGLNNAESTFDQKFRTKQLFLDFLDLPHAVELGASRQFQQLVQTTCGKALGCINNNDQQQSQEQQIPPQITPSILLTHEEMLNFNLNTNIVVPTITPQCLQQIKTTVQDISELTYTNQYKLLSKRYSSDILDACYVNWLSVNRHDVNETSIYAQSRRYQSPLIFDPKRDTSLLISNQYRSIFETYLDNIYKQRRDRHGTYDAMVYGPIFRRSKTILIDVRVGRIDPIRMLFETQWKWLQNELLISIIPSIEQLYFNNKDNSNNIIKNEFLSTIKTLQYEYSIINQQTGTIEFDQSKLQVAKDNFITTLQCHNPHFISTHFIELLQKYNNGQYLRHGADLIFIGSGLLVASWGKYFSEGWRETHTERIRILELTSRMMSLSRQRVDEWKYYFTTRELICTETLPYITFNSEVNGHVQVKLNDVIKPIGVTFMTGDIHFAEAARTYIPFNLLIPEPMIVSNTANIPIDTIYDSLLSEEKFLLTNDTKINGINAINTMKLHGIDINQYMKLIVQDKFNINDYITTQMMNRTFNTQFIAPIVDITSSSITHGWGGGDASKTTKAWFIKQLFKATLRPKITNINFRSKHQWQIDDLEQFYIQHNINNNNNDNVNTNIESQQLQQTKLKLKIPILSTDFTTIRAQDRYWVHHNIADINIDWDNDLIHIAVKSKELDNALWFSSKIEHHRAYTLPQIASFKTRFEYLNKNKENNNDIKQNNNDDKDNQIYETIVKNHKAWIKDILYQVDEEVTTRLSAPISISQGGLMFGILIILIIIIISICICCRQCYICICGKKKSKNNSNDDNDEQLSINKHSSSQSDLFSNENDHNDDLPGSTLDDLDDLGTSNSNNIQYNRKNNKNKNDNNNNHAVDYSRLDEDNTIPHTNKNVENFPTTSLRHRNVKNDNNNNNNYDNNNSQSDNDDNGIELSPVTPIESHGSYTRSKSGRKIPTDGL